MRSQLSPSLRSRYDYYYSSMSPASSAINYYENQNQSLFGDPVPPSIDFLESLDSHLYGSLRRGSLSNNSFLTENHNNNNRQQSQRQQYSTTSPRHNQHNHLYQSQPTLPQTTTLIENYLRTTSTSTSDSFGRNMPPDERIIQNDVFYNDYRKRSNSSFSDDVRSNGDHNFRNNNEMLPPIPPKRVFSSEPFYTRRLSNQTNRTNDTSRVQSSDSRDSDTNNEWINPINSEWTRIPRPQSRNVTHITHGNSIGTTNGSNTNLNVAGNGNAMVAVIQSDSTTSSSDEKTTSSDRPTSSTTEARIIQVLPYDKRKDSRTSLATSITATPPATSSGESGNEMPIKKRDLSPAIIRETVNTGSAYRYQQPARPHKKTSFAIINEVSANQSRASSPSGRSSPFRGKGFRPSSLPISPKQSSLLIPPDMISGTTTPTSTVQFDISESNKMPHGIFGPRDSESYDIHTDARHKTLIQIHSKTNQQRPFSVLPAETYSANIGPYRNKLYNSTGDLYSESKPSSSASSNPRRNEKGLLRIVNNEFGSPSRIPRRKSLTSTSAGTLHRRKSSISPPIRRVSITTTKPIGTNNDAREKSPAPGSSSVIDLGMMPISSTRSLSRISRPTTLSPILGTPNREPSESIAITNQPNEPVADSSPTKIPIRSRRNSNATASRSNSRSQSRAPSNANSRDPSPRQSNQSPNDRSIDNSLGNREGSKKRLSVARKQSVKTSTDTKGKSVPAKEKSKVTTESKPLVTKKPPSFRRNTSISTSTKKEATTTASKTKKEAVPSLKREPSNVKKPTPSVKREKSTVKKETTTATGSTALKREPSNVTKKTTGTLKRQSSKISIAAAMSKTKSDVNLTKKLEKKNSFKKDKTDSVDKTTSNASSAVIDTEPPDNTTNKDETERDPSLKSQESNETSDKLVAMTKSNVVSMTTAAITAQPVQITTAVTNQTTITKSNSSHQLIKTDSSGQILSSIAENSDMTPATILEKSQKTLENIQKTVTEATDEIQKTIEENLTDLKSLENDMKMVESGQMLPAPFEKKESTRTLKSIHSTKSGDGDRSDVDSIRPTVTTTAASPIEAKVSVIDGGATGSINGSNGIKLTPQDSDERVSVRSVAMLPDVELESGNMATGASGMKKNAEPGNAESRSENGDEDEQQQTCCKVSKCCTPCCNRLCLPCTRVNNRCCRSKGKKIVDTIVNENEKQSFWKRIKWCRGNKKEDKPSMKTMSETTMERVSTVGQVEGGVIPGADVAKRGKCRLCIDKFLCCRKTNKIESSNDDNEMGKCCFCFPKRKQLKRGSMAWADSRRSSNLSEPEKKGCCSRLCSKLICCKRKSDGESRRTSMNSKKQSIAPTLPPEDNRPKLDMSLVEHTSMMKAAIPVLPVCLAWFCLICNCFVPGFGTICSGIFNLCLGVPRFSQHDGARVRIGSFVINCIVGVAQAFTLLFCLVGWGWSIWWGTTMLKVARKHRKIKMAEAALEDAQTTNTSSSNPPVVSQNHRDIEAS